MPQHVKRIKIDRKALRQPDEFHTLSTQAAEWVRTHQPVAYGVLAAVVAIMLVVVLVGRIRTSHTQAAALDFRAAHSLFEAGKYADAARSFAGLADTYAGTPFGRLAALYRGHALIRQGDAAGAVTAYQGFLAGGVASGDLRQEGLMGLAYAREKSGDVAGALETYTQAGELAGPFRTQAQLAAARIDEAQGRTDQARSIYEQLLKTDPDPDLRALLVTKLPAGTVAAEQP